MNDTPTHIDNDIDDEDDAIPILPKNPNIHQTEWDDETDE